MDGWMDVCMHACKYVYMDGRVYVYVSVYMVVYVYLSVYTCVHTYISAYTCVYMLCVGSISKQY